MTKLKTEFTTDVKELEEAAFNVQRREPWYCAIVSSKNGETVLEAIIQDGIIRAQNDKTFSEAEKVHITVKGGRPVAVCNTEEKQVLIWAKTTK